MILVYKRFKLQPFFVAIGSAEKDDYVTKYGQRTGKTSGYVKSTKYVRGRPDLNLIRSSMVQLPGDSGCPWVTSGPTLVGMGSSGNQEDQGGEAGSQAQPINSVITMIRNNPTDWGTGFKVWTE